jgi:hypothetical protein
MNVAFKICDHLFVTIGNVKRKMINTFGHEINNKLNENNFHEFSSVCNMYSTICKIHYSMLFYYYHIK